MYQYIRKNGGFCSIRFKIDWRGTIENRYDLLEQEQKIIDTFPDGLRFNKNDPVNDFLLKNDPVKNAQQTNRERSLKYYHDNAGRINRHIECYCGSIITYNGRSMHKKTFRHLSYEPIALIPLFDE
jgi:hypothetical protein